jgi:hypothetical protein
MKKWLLIVAAIPVFAACKKVAGDGGLAKIKGRIYKQYRLVLTNPSTIQNTVPDADESVYIIYGDEVSPGQKIESNPDGDYEFLNLREGKYTVYVYSKDTTGTGTIDPNKMVVKQSVEITSRKQEKTIDDMTIYDVH